MKNLKNSKLLSKKKLYLWSGLFSITTVCYILARGVEGFGEWYAGRVYPVLVGSIGRLFSGLPFSMSELLFYLGIFLILGDVFYHIVRKKVDKKYLKNRGFILLRALVILWALFVFGCGINYERETFSEKVGFEIEEYSKADLVTLCEKLILDLNESAKKIDTDENGYCISTIDLEENAVEAMENLGKIYEELSGYYPNPKGLINSAYLSYQQLQGIYSPFTIEANYNQDMPDSDKPSTICHELSHLKGFMREDEANFIAYLACIESDQGIFEYSGNMLAYIYSINALYADDPELAIELQEQVCEQARRDLQYRNQWWSAYDGTVAEVSDKVNDTYLKANNQEDGVKSYGRMVDLLIVMNKQGVDNEEEK